MVNWSLIAAILAPNVGGWLGILVVKGQISRPDGKTWYQQLKKPSWTPPAWVYGPAWTVFYCCMGYASYRVYRKLGGFTSDAVYPLSLYGGQLVLNWAWAPIFYTFHNIGFSVWHLVAIDIAAVACTTSFYQTTPIAGHLMLPYLGWLAFATCLNYTIWKLNP